MSYLDRLSGFAAVKVAAVAIFALGASVATSDALTLKLEDLAHGGATQNIAGVDGTAFFAGGFGNFQLVVSTATETEFPPLAGLSLNNTVSTGAGHIRVTAESSSLSVPDLPLAFLNVGQDINPLNLPVGSFDGSVIMTLRSYLSIAGGSFDLIGNMAHSNTPPNSQEFNRVQDLIASGDPVAFRHVFEFRGALAQGNSVQASATANLAPIPLPAAGWLLIGGLGTLIAIRRRKKAA